MGNVADRIGRRRLLLIGTAGFGVSSVLAALAPGAGALIAARALLGVSGATIMPSTLSLVRNIFPGARRRATAIAIWSAGASGGTALTATLILCLFSGNAFFALSFNSFDECLFV